MKKCAVLLLFLIIAMPKVSAAEVAENDPHAIEVQLSLFIGYTFYESDIHNQNRGRGRGRNRNRNRDDESQGGFLYGGRFLITKKLAETPYFLGIGSSIYLEAFDIDSCDLDNRNPCGKLNSIINSDFFVSLGRELNAGTRFYSNIGLGLNRTEFELGGRSDSTTHLGFSIKGNLSHQFSENYNFFIEGGVVFWAAADYDNLDNKSAWT